MAFTTQQLEVFESMLSAIEASPTDDSDVVMAVALWGDTIEFEMFKGLTFRARPAKFEL